MHRHVLFALVVLAGCATTSPLAPAMWNGLQPGPHRVGFRTERLTSPPHVLDVSIWYPAARGGTPMTYADYVGPDRDSYIKDVTGAGVSETSARGLLAQPLAARSGAAPETGSYPLVLVAQGNYQWAAHQAVLAEFLVSHGYVVATVPSISLLIGPMSTEDDLPRYVSDQTDDLQRAEALAFTLPSVDRSRVAVLGHSLGTRAALLFAIRQPVRAIVTLDAGVGTARGVTSFPKPSRELPPLMHLYQENDSDRIHPDFTFLRSLPIRELRIEKLDSLRHAHFSTIGYAAALYPEMARVTKAGEGLRADVAKVATMTLDFLDRNVK